MGHEAIIRKLLLALADALELIEQNYEIIGPLMEPEEVTTHNTCAAALSEGWDHINSYYARNGGGTT